MDNINQSPSQLTEEKKSHFPNKVNLRLILLRFSFITLLILVIILYIQLNAEQTKRHLMENTLQEISSAKELLDKELQDTTNLMKQLTDQLNEAKEELAAQIKEKDKLVSERTKLEENVNNTTNFSQKISSQLNEISIQLKEIKEKLETEIKEKEKLIKERTKLEENMKLVQEAKETLENKIRESIIKKDIELGKIVVNPKPINKNGIGEIISVNRESRFVVINAGKKDGIKKGLIFKILRGGLTIGKVKIQKVYTNTCIGDILIEEQTGKIQEGDTVAYF